MPFNARIGFTGDRVVVAVKQGLHDSVDVPGDGMKTRFVEDVTLTLQFAAAALAVVAVTLTAAARGFLLLLLRRAEAGTGRAEEIPHEDPVEEDRVHGDDGGQANGASREK